MKELSLFSGTGGGLLASHLLGWTPIGYVEFEPYCQRVLSQRIQDGVLPNAPIFSDVREFIQSGAAAEYRGFTDVVSGGFPCQPFSVAGKRKGSDDERNMWPSTLEVIRQVRPRYCLLENVRGLLWSGYFPQILKELAESGYDVRWRVLSAAEVGAPHRRERLWIACARSDFLNTQCSGFNGNGKDEQKRQRQEIRGDQLSRGNGNDREMADTASQGLEGTAGQVLQGNQPGFTSSSWWEVEPNVGRVVDGLAFRVDRLKAIGNGQVPAVAAAAWHLLTEGWIDDKCT